MSGITETSAPWQKSGFAYISLQTPGWSMHTVTLSSSHNPPTHTHTNCDPVGLAGLFEWKTEVIYPTHLCSTLQHLLKKLLYLANAIAAHYWQHDGEPHSVLFFPLSSILSLSLERLVFPLLPPTEKAKLQWHCKNLSVSEHMCICLCVSLRVCV